MAPKRSKNQIRRERAKLRKTEAGKAAPVDDTTTSISDEKTGVLAESAEPLEKPQVAVEEQAKASENDKKTAPSTEKDETASEKSTLRVAELTETPILGTSTTETNGQHTKSLEAEFASVFERFEAKQEDPDAQIINTRNSGAANADSGPGSNSSSGSDSDSDSDYEKPLSKRQLRKRNKIPIAELKAATTRPLAVEWFDVDAPDPFLVVKLKTMPNAVDVPSHWQQKKEYLSSKRGLERPPFKLPKFIEDTGIAEMRNHDEDSLKKLQRDRVQPKMGKLDIDYQKLHDAFFKHQKKPKLLAFGELYYEGREKNDVNRDQIKHMGPGKISRALKAAVGLPENGNSPPPWVVLMNELGKPPAYLDCIIPGVDIEYSNLGYKIARDQNWGQIELLELLWGHMEDVEESEEEELESEEEVEEDEGVDEIEDATENQRLDNEDEPEKVDISEYSRLKTDFGNQESSTSSGSLYTVLKERTLDVKNGTLVEGRQGYEYADKEEAAKEKEPERRTAQPETTNFKF